VVLLSGTFVKIVQLDGVVVDRDLHSHRPTDAEQQHGRSQPVGPNREQEDPEQTEWDQTALRWRRGEETGDCFGPSCPRKCSGSNFSRWPFRLSRGSGRSPCCTACGTPLPCPRKTRVLRIALREVEGFWTFGQTVSGTGTAQECCVIGRFGWKLLLGCCKCDIYKRKDRNHEGVQQRVEEKQEAD